MSNPSVIAEDVLAVMEAHPRVGMYVASLTSRISNLELRVQAAEKAKKEAEEKAKKAQAVADETINVCKKYADDEKEAEKKAKKEAAEKAKLIKEAEEANIVIAKLELKLDKAEKEVERIKEKATKEVERIKAKAMKEVEMTMERLMTYTDEDHLEWAEKTLCEEFPDRP